MTDPKVTVMIPVGPGPSHTRWLDEAIGSVQGQTLPPDELLIVTPVDDLHLGDVENLRVATLPCDLGVVSTVNFGVAMARYPLVIILASDDKLMPWCIADAIETYENVRDDLGYYWFDVEYSDGTAQSIASGPVMVTKALWQHIGGYPPESAVGAPDHILTSAINAAKGQAGRLHKVNSAAPPYWFRLHPEQIQETLNRKYGSVIGLIRDIICNDWAARQW